MNEDLAGKKLLILGGNPETLPLVEIANAMGVKTIVTSFRESDPAKKAAWKSFNVDGMDVPGLIALAHQEAVDGVLVGVADVLVPSYCKVCAALGLPSYATEDIVNVFAFKDTFKATCERYGVHGIPEYYLDAELRPEDVAKIDYPVVVKPVDGFSGIGMSVVYNENELRPAVQKALNASIKKRFIVEKYMQCDDVGIYYTFKDGYCSLSCIYDRFTTEEQRGLSRVCLGGIYPSKHINDYYERMHDNAIRMFRDIGVKDGVLMISAFYADGEFYVYDPGFRLQGEAPHLLLKAIHGYDQREMLIRFALTGSIGEIDLQKIDDPRLSGKAAATLWILLREGIIGEIKGFEEIEKEPFVKANVQRLHVGDHVLHEWIGTEKQVLTRFYVVCEDKPQLINTLRRYVSLIRVLDTDGKDMVIPSFV